MDRLSPKQVWTCGMESGDEIATNSSTIPFRLLNYSLLDLSPKRVVFCHAP